MENAIEPQVKQYSLEERKIVEEIMDHICGYHIDMSDETFGAIRDRADSSGYWATKNIVGKMLTIIDSVMEDKERREATKSIIRQMIQEERVSVINHLYEKYKNN